MISLSGAPARSPKITRNLDGGVRSKPPRSLRDASLTEALIPKTGYQPSCRRERSQHHIELAAENLLKACTDPAGLAST